MLVRICVCLRSIIQFVCLCVWTCTCTRFPIWDYVHDFFACMYACIFAYCTCMLFRLFLPCISFLQNLKGVFAFSSSARTQESAVWRSVSHDVTGYYCDDMWYWCDVGWCEVVLRGGGMMWGGVDVVWREVVVLWCGMMWGGVDMMWYDAMYYGADVVLCAMQCDVVWCDVTTGVDKCDVALRWWINVMWWCADVTRCDDLKLSFRVMWRHETI